MGAQEDNKLRNLNEIDDTFGSELRYFIDYFKKIGPKARLVLLIALALAANVFGYYMPMRAHASGANMYLYWDPAVYCTATSNAPGCSTFIPSSWCNDTSYNGYFPVGGSSLGTTTSATTGPYSLTVASGSMQTPTGPSLTAGGALLFNAAVASNPPTSQTIAGTASITSDSNGDSSHPDTPAFRDLELIEYVGSGGPGSGSTCTVGSGGGIPTTIPAYGIALFTALPSGWTADSNQNNEMIRLGSSNATGGGDTESNNITEYGIKASAGSASLSTLLGSIHMSTANADTHDPPAAMTCSSGCAASGSTPCTLVGSAGAIPNSGSTFTCTSANVDPPYVAPILAYTTTSTPTITVDVTCMFDANPGAGWTELSNGGQYTSEFIRPNNSSPSLTSQGVATRPSEAITANTGPGTQVSGSVVGTGTGGVQSAAVYTYSITTNTTTNDNIPSNVTVIFAEKVSFTLENYWWYADSGANNVCTPWPKGNNTSQVSGGQTGCTVGSGLGVSEDMGIPAIPAPYDPPSYDPTSSMSQQRLRIQIEVTGQALVANNTSFELEYAQTTATDCITGSWTPVGNGGAVWNYGTEGGLSNDTTLTHTEFPSGGSTDLETFSDSTSGATTPTAASTGATIEFDWVVTDNGAVTGSQYAFRPIEVDGQPLGSYFNSTAGKSECPTIVTAPNTSQELRHGQFFQDGVNEGFEWAD